MDTHFRFVLPLLWGLSPAVWAVGQGDLTFTLGAGLERAHLDWNLADADGSPDVLSELTFDDQRLVRTDGELALDVNSGPFAGLAVRVNGHFADVRSGQVTDRDWNQDNRQGLFSESRSALEGDTGRGGRILLGYHLRLGRVDLVPLAGWATLKRTLRIRNGTQIVGTASLEGLDSTYATRWSGPWLGAEIRATHGRWAAQLRLGTLYGDYEGEGDWNLRTDLAHPVSYRHRGNRAWLAEAQSMLAYQSERGWRLGVTLGYQAGRLESGTDTLFMASGTTIESPLNAVSQHSVWGMLNAGWQWH